MLEAGVNVSLGTDGCGSIENANMLKVMHAMALIHKLRGDDYARWIGADDAFHAATAAGAKALGMDDMIGQLRAGMRADLSLWRTDSIPFAPLNDPLRQLVFNETGANLAGVFVDGEPVLEQGRLTRIDEASILDEIAAEWGVLEPLIADRERKVEKMFPSYRRIWDRCCATDIDHAIFPARFDR
jgi:guanine deaminase